MSSKTNLVITALFDHGAPVREGKKKKILGYGLPLAIMETFGIKKVWIYQAIALGVIKEMRVEGKAGSRRVFYLPVGDPKALFWRHLFRKWSERLGLLWPMKK